MNSKVMDKINTSLQRAKISEYPNTIINTITNIMSPQNYKKIIPLLSRENIIKLFMSIQNSHLESIRDPKEYYKIESLLEIIIFSIFFYYNDLELLNNIKDHLNMKGLIYNLATKIQNNKNIEIPSSLVGSELDNTLKEVEKQLIHASRSIILMAIRDHLEKSVYSCIEFYIINEEDVISLLLNPKDYAKDEMEVILYNCIENAYIMIEEMVKNTHVFFSKIIPNINDYKKILSKIVLDYFTFYVIKYANNDEDMTHIINIFRSEHHLNYEGDVIYEK